MARRKSAEVVELPVRRPARAMTASASVINIGDRTEAERVKKFRQNWQEEAWAYRDSVPELGFAMRFIANAIGRMRLFIGVYVNPEDEQPTPLKESGLPSGIMQKCEDALARLGGSRLSVTALLQPMAENWEVAGECWLVGIEDPETHLEEWSIRSIDEIRILDNKYWLYDMPGGRAEDGVEIDPLTSFVVRLWNPHPRWSRLADCPMRQLLDVCEELMILSRDIRAAGRSRLAGNGILGIPTGLTVGGADDAQADGEETEDPFMAQLTEAMVAPIADEGVASAIVPIIVRGEADLLKAIVHISLSRPVDATSAQTRKELRERMATGIDLPNAIINGLADANHWSAWAIDDDTFRHHLEPKIISYCDALTVGYLRVVLKADGVDVDTLQKIVMWYDPTELVTHPDRSADARDLWDRNVLSDEGLLLACGWSEKDRPKPEEFLTRLIAHSRTFDPGVVGAILHRLDPTLPITVPSGQVAVKDGRNPETPTPGLPPPTPPGTAPPTEPTAPPKAAPNPTQPTKGPPPTPTGVAPPGGASPAAASAKPGSLASRPATGYLAPLVADGAVPKVVNRELSRKLVDLDRSLRDRLSVAAEALLTAQLERAGARVRSKIQGNATAQALAASTPNRYLVAALGQPMVMALGADEEALLKADYASLHSKWNKWVSAAQVSALKIAAKLARVPQTDSRLAKANAQMAKDREAAWIYLEASLHKLVHKALYNPHPNAAVTSAGAKVILKAVVDGESDSELNIVDAGTMRAAIAIAGGFGNSDMSAGIGPDGKPADPSEIMGQIGTGDTVSEFLASAGVEQAGYVWVHGDSDHAFPDHEALDGVEFASFDDPQLDGSFFAGYEQWVPGDHSGCTCDFMPLWAIDSGSSDALDEILPADSVPSDGGTLDGNTGEEPS